MSAGVKLTLIWCGVFLANVFDFIESENKPTNITVMYSVMATVVALMLIGIFTREEYK